MRAHLIISGDVQGVGFRAFVLRSAKGLGLTGWVKNRDDGAVETIAEGQDESLSTFVEFCKKGPDVAWVKDVEIQWETETGEWEDFAVVY